MVMRANQAWDLALSLSRNPIFIISPLSYKALVLYKLTIIILLPPQTYDYYIKLLPSKPCNVYCNTIKNLQFSHCFHPQPYNIFFGKKSTTDDYSRPLHATHFMFREHPRQCGWEKKHMQKNYVYKKKEKKKTCTKKKDLI